MVINIENIRFSYAIPDEINYQIDIETNQSRDQLFEGLNNEEAISFKKIIREYESLFYKEGENLSYTT